MGDKSISRLTKEWFVKQLTILQNLRNSEDKPVLGTRMRILIQNVVEQGWAKSSVDTDAHGDQPVERRIDRDGKAYTLQDMLLFYRPRYSEKEIRHYFMFVCKP